MKDLSPSEGHVSSLLLNSADLSQASVILILLQARNKMRSMKCIIHVTKDETMFYQVHLFLQSNSYVFVYTMKHSYAEGIFHEWLHSLILWKLRRKIMAFLQGTWQSHLYTTYIQPEDKSVCERKPQCEDWCILKDDKTLSLLDCMRDQECRLNLSLLNPEGKGRQYCQ